jgi:hypothetical protein
VNSEPEDDDEVFTVPFDPHEWAEAERLIGVLPPEQIAAVEQRLKAMLKRNPR